MEVLTTESREPPTQTVTLESTITVDRDHLEPILGALRRGGIAAWDTGRRVTTEEGLDAQAEVRVRIVP
ncbi:MAG: hypothetical protein LC624_00530 [Halobacteriales archaeon]|nr:hypothetical protein [Halobacteriales archaeon]